MKRRPPRTTQSRSSAASDVYKRQSQQHQRSQCADPAEGRCGSHLRMDAISPVSYTHLRAHGTRHDLVCRLLLEKKKDIGSPVDVSDTHLPTQNTRKNKIYSH